MQAGAGAAGGFAPGLVGRGGSRQAEAAVDAFRPGEMPGPDRAGPGTRPAPAAAGLRAALVGVEASGADRRAAAARAGRGRAREDAWLRGDHARVLDIATPVYTEARRLRDDLVHQAELGYWLTTAGDSRLRRGPPTIPTRCRQQAGGGKQRGLRQAGMPSTARAALAESPEPEDLLTALGMLDELGATPLATTSGRLRTLGATRIPRGPLEETRVNPAGLTTRQIEVVRLLGKGYTNAQIASQLVVPVRTVDSHVAAVLAKLGAASARGRGQRGRARCPRRRGSVIHCAEFSSCPAWARPWRR